MIAAVCFRFVSPDDTPNVRCSSIEKKMNHSLPASIQMARAQIICLSFISFVQWPGANFYS
jgi:hypothetical protein